MRKLSRLLIVGALLAVMVTPVFAGGEQEAAGGDEVTISWWALSSGGGDQSRQQLREQAITDYEQAHPGVTVELTMLENEAFKQRSQVAVQSGDPPDIFHSWGGGVMVEYAQAGMLRDITDFVESNLSDRIGSGALGVYGYDGRYYGAPYDMGAFGIWYNQAIFEEAGVSVPETWEELLSAVRDIKAAGYVPIAVGGGDRWPAHHWWAYLATRLGGEEAFNAAYSGSGSFTDEPFVRAGELLLELNALDPFQTGYLGATYDEAAAVMGSGQGAMQLMGQWNPAVIAANSPTGEGLGEDLGWFRFPTVAGGEGELTDVLGGGNGYVVGANAPDEALDFLDFFLQAQYSEELIEVEGIIPAVVGAQDALSSNPHSQRIAQVVSEADYFQLYYDQYLPPAVGETVKDAVVSLLAGQITPEECAAMIDESWQDQQ